MATNRRRRKRSQQARVKPPAFYEAMGAFAPAPMLLPMSKTDSTSLHTATPKTQVPLAPTMRWADQEWFQRLVVTMPAARHDLLAGMRAVGRALVGQRARGVYMMVVAASIVSGVAIGGSMAANTVDKYRAVMSSPAAIIANKHVGTTITDRNGVVLYQAYGATEHPYLKLSDTPQSVINATLAAEDPSFYDHQGFSLSATARAAITDIRHDRAAQGGSTISQQLVKYNLLTSEKSLNRKFNELALSVELERRYSKDQILEMYLNSIYYGQGAYGIEAASQTYYHKPAKDLTVAEASLLAGLPQSPSRYDPTIAPDQASARRDYVLDRQREVGYLTAAQVTAAKQQPISTFSRQSTLRAPWFVFYVLDQLKQIYGEDTIENGGLTVRTTLDVNKEEVGEQAVRNQIASLAGNHVTNAGLISLDPTNGDILAMVGSVDYYNPSFGSVNTTLSELQPGSSIKPLVYATAFTKGYSGATVVKDEPLKINVAGTSEVYAPQNYDSKFRGPVTLRRALSNSLNIPAVEVEMYAGLDSVIAQAQKMGLTTISNDPGRYGPSFTLGGVEARPIDMAAAYAVFARGGTTVQPRSVLTVTNKLGENITKPVATTSQSVLDARIAYQITSILSDNAARVEEFGANSPLQLSRPNAAKTGTTNDFRDNWTIGYTPSVVTAVWAGNNDHTPMNGINGVTGAAPIWHNYMEAVLAGTPVEQFAQPAGMVAARICAADGGLVDPGDPRGAVEYFLAERQPTTKCGAAPKK